MCHIWTGTNRSLNSNDPETSLFGIVQEQLRQNPVFSNWLCLATWLPECNLPTSIFNISFICHLFVCDNLLRQIIICYESQWFVKIKPSVA
jgi:hypothetical protein